ncbi:hypothetical protein GQ651_01595 [Alphaproteobacteria bacterium GH1-50]|uniref:Type 1 capsular polysaccharide biosynthesis protein J n=1 Tax=Kangsaoukella pontilimi TaxID=2691042 RepID=A0A7C9MBL8_9RHOB|nr:DUF6356 family protein [Kangsaoukella pontilimi]MXQ06532.1 hypothetical protein [Kangsaoukella pontilimi]
MITTLSRAFTQHPASVDETYFEHLLFASRFAARLFAAGGAALIHAILPFMFEKTASNLIRAMHNDIVNR